MQNLKNRNIIREGLWNQIDSDKDINIELSDAIQNLMPEGKLH